MTPPVSVNLNAAGRPSPADLPAAKIEIARHTVSEIASRTRLLQTRIRASFATVRFMGVSHKKLANWYLQGGQNLDAGLPLASALQSEGGPPPKDLAALAGRLQSGESVEKVLETAPEWLPKADRLLIAAAAESGKLPDTLRKLSQKHTQTARNIGKAVFATLYPLGVLHFGIFLFPVFNLVEFTDSGGMQFHIEDYFRNVLLFLLPLWVVTGLFIFLAKQDSREIAFLMRVLPGLRGYRKSQGIADFAFALEAFLRAGAPIAKSWAAAGEISRQPDLVKASQIISDKIKAGEAPGKHLVGLEVFPPDFSSYYQTGEETGQLDTNLALLNRQYQEKADKSLALSSFWYPKLIFVLLAFYAAFKILAFYSQYLQGVLKLIE